MNQVHSPKSILTNISSFNPYQVSPKCSFPKSPTSQKSFQNFDSPKVLQRKPSFKGFQRKQSHQNQAIPKICYISPQKSDIFKKYLSYTQLGTQLSISDLTDNQITGISMKQKFTFKQPNLNLNTERSIFADVKNKCHKDYQTPKRIKNQSKQQIKTKNNQKQSQITLQSQQNEDSHQYENSKKQFIQNDNDFQQSYKTCKNQYICSKNIIESQKYIYQDGQLKQNKILQQKCYQLIKKNELLQQNYKKIEDEKIKLEQRCKVFFNEIQTFKQQQKILQTNCDELLLIQQNCLKQIQQKNLTIKLLQTQVKQLKSSNFNKQIYQHQMQLKRHYQTQTIKLNEQIKYMRIENDILKKQLTKNVQKDQQIIKLQKAQKKLYARNRNLQKSLQELQKQNQQIQKLLNQKQKNSSHKQNVQSLIQQLNRLNQQLNSSKIQNDSHSNESLNLSDRFLKDKQFTCKTKQDKKMTTLCNLINTPKNSKTKSLVSINTKRQGAEFQEIQNDEAFSLMSLDSIQTLDFDLTPDAKHFTCKQLMIQQIQEI